MRPVSWCAQIVAQPIQRDENVFPLLRLGSRSGLAFFILLKFMSQIIIAPGHHGKVCGLLHILVAQIASGVPTAACF